MLRYHLLTACGIVLASSQSALADVDYLKDVKPLFASKCGACHGVLKQEAGLRLDASQLIRKGSENGPIFEPGQSANSPLIQRVSSADENERMPPHGEGEPLKPDQIELLRAWIDGGAKAPELEEAAEDPKNHWAYQKPVRPTLPASDANPIDALLEARRREHGLAEIAAADRATLLRRIYFDLIGLPPSRPELNAFLQDSSSNAYERVVDELLSRPEYGERWGRHWMDVWRYSDWDGFGNELRGSQKHIWHWRDWIIESLNANKPYDQMVREMLAGDEIAPSDPDVLRATGFLSRGYYKFNRQMWLDNVVEHTGKSFLGLTLNCAKCHDHKYDPLAQRDYYTFQAIFEPYNVRLDRLPGELDIEKNGLSRVFDADAATPTYMLVRGDERNPDKSAVIPPALPGVFETAFTPEPVTLPIEAVAPYLHGPESDFLKSQVAGEVTQAQNALAEAEKVVGAAVQRRAFLAAASGETNRFTPALINDDFANLDDSRWEPAAGEFAVVDGQLRQTRVSTETSRLVTRTDAPADFQARFQFKILGGQTYHSVGLSFDWLDDKNSKSVYLSAHPPGPKVQVSAVKDGNSSYPAEGMKALSIQKDRVHTLEVSVRDKLVNVVVDGELVVVYTLPDDRRPGKFAVWAFDSQAEFLNLSLSTLAADVPLAATPAEIGTFATNVEQATRNALKAGQNAAIARRKFAAAQTKQASFESRLAAEQAKYAEPSPPETAALSTVASAAQRIHRILQAEAELAEAQQKQDAARAALKPDDDATKKALDESEAAFTKARVSLESARSQRADSSYEPVSKTYPATSTGRRLAFAKWVTTKDNPLTARVAVNHIWLRHFGRPLVNNTFDFGLRSPKPRHQDVLDWLAVELTDHGWDMKRIHRLIVTSRTYQRASAPSGETSDVAAWEQNRKADPDNADFWHADVRRLDAEAVRDAVLVASGSLDSTRGGPDIDYMDGEKVNRRSVYFRHAYEKQMRFLTTFDAASPNECYRRSESVIPHQALAMANSRLSLTESRILAERLWKESEQTAMAGDAAVKSAAFIDMLFETVLTRPATVDERRTCLAFLASQEAVLAKPESLTSFTGGDEPGRAPSTDPVQRARENLAHVLLNHNDFATVR
jgi:hypothetical protein